MTLHHLRATGLHLPYEITQCYLPPDTRKSRALNDTPSSQIYGAPLAVFCRHTVTPSTRHKWTHPRSRYSIYMYLLQRDGRLSWPRWPVTYRDGLPAHRRSPIQAL